jgi:dTMP kinase
VRPSEHYRGKLFVVEGIDGSGKSTQIQLLYKWLLSQGYSTFFSEWNSSPLVKRTTRRGKNRHLLTPLTFSLIHSTDFADRTERNIIPPLRAGAAVLADRYTYTAFARDAARECDPGWVREIYSFAVKPAVAFYFRVPLEVALERILTGRPEIKWYEAGQDLGLADDPYESFKLFQARIVQQYDKIVEEFGLTVIDGTLPIATQQQKVREIAAPYLEGLLKRPEDAWIPAPIHGGEAE